MLGVEAMLLPAAAEAGGSASYRADLLVRGLQVSTIVESARSVGLAVSFKDLTPARVEDDGEELVTPSFT